MKYILKKLLFPIFVIQYLLIKIISPLKVIRFGILPTMRIGHFSADIHYYLTEEITPKSNNLDIFIKEEFISNDYLYKVYKTKLIILPNFFFSEFIRLLKFFFKDKKHLVTLNPTTSRIDKSITINNSKIYIFSNKEKNFFREFLNYYNFDPGKKIVLLMARDDAYLKATYSFKKWNYHNFRDVNINNLVPTINYLLSKNYQVIRMGKISKKKLDINNNLFIDYSFSKFRDDSLDIQLIKNCDFIISNSLGLDSVGQVFDKPIFFFSLIPYISIHSQNKNRFSILKKIYSNEKKRYMSMSEVFKCNLYNVYDGEIFEKLNLTIEENDPNEILIGVKEFLDVVNNQNHKLTLLQEKFWKNFERNILEKKCDEKNLHKKKMISLVGNNFIEKNNFFLE